jgi:flavodoxin
MKALVTYASNTGRTRKVADAIFNELECEKEIREIAQAGDLDEFDVIFVGFPIIAFGPNPVAKEFLENNASGRQIAMFVTHGAPEDSPDVAGWLNKCRAPAAGAAVLGVFDCQGEVDDNVIQMLLKSDNPMMRQFGEMGPSTKGQPDASRLKKARDFARQVMAKL